MLHLISYEGEEEAQDEKFLLLLAKEEATNDRIQAKALAATLI